MKDNMPTGYFDLNGKNGKGTFLMRLTRFCTTIWVKVFYKIDVHGADNIPEEGPFLIYSNHETAMDMFFIGYNLKRYIRWMAKDTLFKNPIARFFLQRMGAFSAGRAKGGLLSSINTSKKLLDSGEIVGIFPEGHRRKISEANGFKVHSGVAMIGCMCDVPVVPVHLVSSGKKFSSVKVTFGEPFKVYVEKDNEQIERSDEKQNHVSRFGVDREELKQISNDMMQRLYDL